LFAKTCILKTRQINTNRLHHAATLVQIGEVTEFLSAQKWVETVGFIVTVSVEPILLKESLSCQQCQGQGHLVSFVPLFPFL
jgi:hypothetical protein